MGTVIFWLSVCFSGYWTFLWLKYCNFSVVHFPQFIAALMLWSVVLYFYFSPDVSTFHMLWAMPVALFLSSFLTAPFTLWRKEYLAKKVLKASAQKQNSK